MTTLRLTKFVSEREGGYAYYYCKDEQTKICLADRAFQPFAAIRPKRERVEPFDGEVNLIHSVGLFHTHYKSQPGESQQK